MMKRYLMIGVVSLLLMSVAAAVPQKMNFQGRLTDTGGNPITTAVDVKFSIFDASSGGSELWTETISGLIPDQGLVNQELGLSTAITSAIFSGDTRYLAVKIGTDAEMVPRIPLATVPFAFRAATADTVPNNSLTANKFVTGQIVTGLSSSGSVTALKDNVVIEGGSGVSISQNDLLNKLTITANSTAGGTVTQVNTGTGLTGGPITSSGTVLIANGGVAAAQLATGAVTAGAIADDTITEAKLNIMNAAVNNTVLSYTPTGMAWSAQGSGGDMLKSVYDVANNGKVDYVDNLMIGQVTAGAIAAGAISASNLGTNVITAGAISMNSVTSGAIAINTITASNLGTNVITAGAISMNSVTSGAIAVNSILASNFGTNVVTASAIATGAVTAGAIASNAVVTSLTSQGSGSLLRDNVTLVGGTGITLGQAGQTITVNSTGGGGDMFKATYDTNLNNKVDYVDNLTIGQVTVGAIANDAVVTAGISNGAVTAGKIASGQIVTSITSQGSGALLHDAVTFVGGTGITLGQAGQTITVNASGGGINGTAAANKVAYGSGVNTLTSTTNFHFDGTNLSVGTATPSGRILGYYDANNYASLGVSDRGVDALGSTYGVYSQTSGTGTAVYGTSGAMINGFLCDPNYGAYGLNDISWGFLGSLNYGAYGISGSRYGYLGSSNYGAYGSYDASDYGYLGGSDRGVDGYTEATAGYGVYGWNAGATGNSIGVYGNSSSATGRGVNGYAGGGGVCYGVYGETNSASGYGVRGNSQASPSNRYGFLGSNAFGAYGSYSTTKYGYLGSTDYGAYGTDGTNNGVFAHTSNSAGVYGDSSAAAGKGVEGYCQGGTGASMGIYGRNRSATGYGVYGWGEDSSGGVNFGGYFQSESAAGYGCYGLANSATGTNYGVYGESKTGGILESYGVYGRTLNVIGYGVYGDSNYIGVFGRCAADTNNYGYLGTSNVGVYGQTNSTSGYGAYGQDIAVTGRNYGGYFKTASSAGLGVMGLSPNVAVSGDATSASVTNLRNYGGYFTSNGEYAVGVYGKVSTTAVKPSSYGGYFEAAGRYGFGVYGEHTNTVGTWTDGAGIYGKSLASNGCGVLGRATNTTAGTGGMGVYGLSDAPLGYGVVGNVTDTGGVNYGGYFSTSSAAGYGVYATGTYAAGFDGRIKMANLAPPGGGTALYRTASNEVVPLASSRRYKKDIVDYNLDLSKLNQLRPVRFKWNEVSATPNYPDFGLIAEEVEQVYPELVTLNQNGSPESVAYDKLGVILIKALQEKNKEIDALKNENESIKSRLKLLEDKVLGSK